MRKTEDIINLILDIYHGHQWEDMEEFFVVAQALLSYHGARFKMLDDLKQFRIDELHEDVRSYHSERQRRVAQDEWYEKCDNDPELQQLNKYDDSEEGLREELNSNTRETSVQIFHKFITFKD